MIIAAKRGRSILLTSHFLDEVDVLSDRIGIIKNGKLITCGSSLFLKHHFGVGYALSFESKKEFDVTSIVLDAKSIPDEKSGTYQWQLNHGSESKFPAVLSALSDAGATNVSLELTTLEQVFLQTGKEDSEDDGDDEDALNDNNDDSGNVENDPEDPSSDAAENLAKIWKPRGSVNLLSYGKKFLLVQHFMMTNAWRIKGTIFLNIGMPVCIRMCKLSALICLRQLTSSLQLMYLVAGMVIVSVVEVPLKGQIIANDPIPLSPFIVGGRPSQFFGVPSIEGFNPISPLIPSEPPGTIEDYFIDGAPPVFGGFYEGNSTLQYAPEVTPFALQIGVHILSNFSAFLDGNNVSSGIATTVQQLPYATDAPFRLDLLLLPMCLAFGFAGLAFSVLDVLLLKGDNIVGMFRVAGISEWMTYLGVMMYKFTTTFIPFFVLVITLGLALGSVLFGNGGRWLGTLLILLGYAYSTGPLGLIIAKRFIHKDFKSVSNWFPG